MNWHTTSRILILILLIIDLVVGGALYREIRSADYLPDDMVSEAVRNLSEKDIFVGDKADTHIYTEPIFAYSAENGYADAMRQNAGDLYPALLSALSFLTGKSLSFVEENTNYFDTPDGLSLSVGDGRDGTIAAATVSGKTHFEFVRSELSENPLDLLSQPNFTWESETAPYSVRKTLSDFFGATYDETVSYTVLNYGKTENYHFVRCAVTLQDRPIADNETVFALSRGKIDALNGEMFFTSPSAAYNATLLDGINILYHLDLPQGSSAELLSEKLYYSFYRYDAREYYLVPAWEVVYRTGAGTTETVYLNALTGKSIARNEETE